MERSESPGGVIHPSPTPGADPHPVSVAIRRPSRSNRGRNPDCAIGGNDSPRAVLVEIFISNHARGNVASGIVTTFAAVAYLAPIVDTIERGCFINFMRQGNPAGESVAL